MQAALQAAGVELGDAAAEDFVRGNVKARFRKGAVRGGAPPCLQRRA